MNAPDRLGLASILGSLSISYAPLIDRERRTFGTRLTMLAVKPSDRLPVGLILEQLNGLWPESRALVLMAPLDAQLDDSLLDWQRRQTQSLKFRRSRCVTRACKDSFNARAEPASKWHCVGGPMYRCLRRCWIASVTR